METELIAVFSHSWAIWVIVAVLCGILEILLPSFFFIFASVGSLGAALISLQFNTAFQLLGFSFVLIISLLFIRPKFLGKFYSANLSASELKSNEVAATRLMPSRAGVLIGKSGTVSEPIDPLIGNGRVFIEGEDWAAISDRSISAGKAITVVGADGIVLSVKEI
jgi:membrane protein implicated in regulation of membrane protease activity